MASPVPAKRYHSLATVPGSRTHINFDVRTLLYQLVGIDLTQIHGIGPYLALRLVAECGTDLSRWRTAQHFTSWLTLAPGCRIRVGKVLSAHTRKTKDRVSAHRQSESGHRHGPQDCGLVL
ncbi:transposase [Aeromonas salmonicida]